jgi:hypothetical protein
MKRITTKRSGPCFEIEKRNSELWAKERAKEPLIRASRLMHACRHDRARQCSMPIDRLGSPDIHGCAGCVAESGASGIAGAEAVAPGVSAGEGVSAIGIGGVGVRGYRRPGELSMDIQDEIKSPFKTENERQAILGACSQQATLLPALV